MNKRTDFMRLKRIFRDLNFRRITRLNGKIFLMAFLLLGMPLMNHAFAAAEDADASANKLQAQIEELKTHLENIEKQQKDIQDKDDKILEELDRVRVWSRRR